MASPERGVLPANLTSEAPRVYPGEAVKRKDEGTVDRSAVLLQFARVLHRACVSRPQILAALAERDDALGWRKYSDRADARRQYERLADLVTRPRCQGWFFPRRMWL